MMPAATHSLPGASFWKAPMALLRAERPIMNSLIMTGMAIRKMNPR